MLANVVPVRCNRRNNTMCSWCITIKCTSDACAVGENSIQICP